MNHILCQAPLFEHLVEFSYTKPQSFHVPGHRNGNVYEQLVHRFTEEQQQYINALTKLAKLDVTELSHTDDLHDPQGVIKQAQSLAAQLYGASHSFFLVGGSTAGNLALVLSLCDSGDTIIVQRNVHKSVINGCKLAEVQAVFLTPEIEEETKLAVVPSLQTVEQAIQRYPHAKAIFLTNPNYYGLSVELKPYIELAHSYNIPLVVDEAHGAHYGIAPNSPNTALASGADAVVQSAHKTLPALTMGAYLHIQSERVDANDIQQQLAIIESSSPSYLLMASLDIARALLQSYGKEMFAQSYQLLQTFIAWLQQNSRLSVKQLSSQKKVRQDPYRILLYDQSMEVSGVELQKMLEHEGVWVEMATASYAVLVWHMAMSAEQLDKLQQAILKIDHHLNNKINSKKMNDINSTLPLQISNKHIVSKPVSFKRKMRTNTALLKLEQSVGKICAEQIIPYPPGIPILFEGEQITEEHLLEINQYVSFHVKFQGAEGLNQGLIKVFTD